MRLVNPKRHEDLEMLHVTFTRVMGGYIKGTLLQCAIIGVGCVVLFGAIGIPNYAALGGIAGHKVLTIPHHNGKMDPAELDEFCKTFYADGNYEHMVFPGSVYVSQSTEYGTIYSKAELQAIADVAHTYRFKSL